MIVRDLVPVTTATSRKGEAGNKGSLKIVGKIGIVGGCDEYTGAPYFAGMTALRMGAEMVHIFCQPSAATVIKGYSPDLIVHPYLTEHLYEKVIQVFPRLNVLLIGSGLGRNPSVLEMTRTIIQAAKEHHIPIIMDGDGIFLVQQWPELLKGYPNGVFTPNANEFNRLCHLAAISTESLMDKDSESAILEAIRPLAHYFGLTILRKGMVDVACHGDTVCISHAQGIHRRCGGQGDVLAGAVATMIAWLGKKTDSTDHYPQVSLEAAKFVRFLSRHVANQHHESYLVTQDLVQQVGPAFYQYHQMQVL